MLFSSSFVEVSHYWGTNRLAESWMSMIMCVLIIHTTHYSFVSCVCYSHFKNGEK
jgi:hypothetical protein